MKKLLPFCLILALGLSAGCKTLFTSTTTAAVFTPLNVAKGTQDTVTAAAMLFLANNPSYTAEVAAAADAFSVLAKGNLTALTPADLKAALANTSISTKTQTQIAAIASLALTTFEQDFSTNLPSLQPQYALFVQAVANGLNAGLGKATVPLSP